MTLLMILIFDSSTLRKSSTKTFPRLFALETVKAVKKAI